MDSGKVRSEKCAALLLTQKYPRARRGVTKWLQGAHHGLIEVGLRLRPTSGSPKSERQAEREQPAGRARRFESPFRM